MKGDAARRCRRMPGTSTPTRLTNSMNIWMWLHSSVISCMQYRNSGDWWGSETAYCMSPRISMLSKAAPTFMAFIIRHLPTSI